MRNPEMEDYQDTEELSDRFPIGMRVLVVDDDPLCLMILKKMLMQCKYNVTACSRAIEALQLLREKKLKFDLVMSDVYMPDIDGFKLLELIGLEMDLPVIMMSANGETNVVMKGITHGACDYLLKPVRIEELRNIWQHVVRKRGAKDVVKEESSGEWDDSEKSFDSSSEYSSKKRKEKFEPGEDQIDDISGLKKARVVWSGELHRLFVKAVNQLGVEKAVPKRILEIMNVQGLTRENVASHLQKYRLGLKRLSGVDIEPHPIASFQADEGGNFGGSMYVQPGGSKPTSSRSSSSTGVFGKSVNQLDSGTLAALKQLQAMQQKGAGNHVKSPRAVKSRHTGFQSQKGLGLQRTSSIELGSLMQDQWTSAWQQHGHIVKKERGCVSGLEMKGDADMPSPGSVSTVEDMETITGFKEVRLEDSAPEPFGLSRIAEESGGSGLLSGTEDVGIPEHDLSDFCLGNSDYFAASPSAFSMSQVFSQQQENWSTDY